MTTPAVTTEIASCPWCDGAMQMKEKGVGFGRRYFFVYCDERLCSAIGPSRRSAAEAVTAWNEVVATWNESKSQLVAGIRAAYESEAKLACRDCASGIHTFENPPGSWWHQYLDRLRPCDANRLRRLLAYIDDALLKVTDT